jgi:hypothetical protein
MLAPGGFIVLEVSCWCHTAAWPDRMFELLPMQRVLDRVLDIVVPTHPAPCTQRRCHSTAMFAQVYSSPIGMFALILCLLSVTCASYPSRINAALHLLRSACLCPAAVMDVPA